MCCFQNKSFNKSKSGFAASARLSRILMMGFATQCTNRVHSRIADWRPVNHSRLTFPSSRPQTTHMRIVRLGRLTSDILYVEVHWCTNKAVRISSDSETKIDSAFVSRLFHIDWQARLGATGCSKHITTHLVPKVTS